MGFISRLFGRKNAEVIDTPEKLAQALGVQYDTLSGRSVTATQAMRVATVFGCVRVLAESLGMLPFHLYERKGREIAKRPEHWLYKLLHDAPNDYMTAQEFWEALVIALCFRGNFYAWKEEGIGGRVTALYPLSSCSVTPKLRSDWEVVYQITFPDGSVDVVGQDKIWHVRGMSVDGLNGLSPISYARESIGLSLATEEHGARLFSNGAVTSGVLSTEQKLTDAAFNRLKEDFKSRHGGLANAHKPMILEMGLDWKQMSLSAQDAQFLESRKFQAEEICRIFRVPPHMVANLDKATFSNIEHQGLSFVTNALTPYMTRVEQRVKAGLLTPKDRASMYGKFNAAALLRGDQKSRYEGYGLGINWGILSPNDCRELEDLAPRDGGDIYLTPMNMTTKPGADNADQTNS